ncbi:MAG: hypothetical protein EPO10_27995 [Reyranella sp.]|uniref:hypothetical protein n=1 Tax=Reyranella sp. TaxID=1929291 RepID=UPI00122A1F44|nr:hypothetical protein [Reyranella sp.]TAJ96855.1 MAG: hypothetical protein EPO41_04830 [Reyranella sp.]TBR22664.1 MAG: hypothetical protein EPO10_27995 [Reyranella sp.]
MPDTLFTAPATFTVAQRIALHRRPLPSHELTGQNFRTWAVAVCHAEVQHRSRDFARIERELNISFDRIEDPSCEERGQYPHEAKAATALIWLSHLQTHESEKRAPFDAKAWRDWPAARRAAWLARRRYLWAGFLKAVRAYRDARALIDQPLAA